MKSAEYYPGLQLRWSAQWRFEHRVLGAIERWNGRRMPDGYHETVLTHVKGIISLANDITNPAYYPHLSEEINLPRLKNLAYFHDAGEKRAGDIPRDKADYSLTKADSDMLDEEYFRNILVPQLPYVTLVGTTLERVSPRYRQHAQYIRSWAIAFYVAAEHVTPDSTDKEALLLKVLDRTDAAYAGLDHYYNPSQLAIADTMNSHQRERRKIPVLSDERINETMYGNLKASAPYLHQLLLLVSDKAKCELAQYYIKLGQKYVERGKGKAFTPFLNAFDGIVVNGENLRETVQERIATLVKSDLNM